MRKLNSWIGKYIVSLLQRVHHICTAKRHQGQNKKKRYNVCECAYIYHYNFLKCDTEKVLRKVNFN